MSEGRDDAGDGPTAVYQRITLRLDETAAAPVAAPEFTSIRVLDLMRIKAAARRALARKVAPPVDEAAALQRLIAAITALDGATKLAPVEICVIEWPEVADLRLDYALIDTTLLVNARLSDDWMEGQIAPTALDAIARGLMRYVETAATGYHRIGGGG